MLDQFTEEQRLLRESVRQFVDTEVRPFIPVMEEHHTFPRDLLARCGELGLTGLVFDERHGGSAQGLTAFCIALEEISRATQTLAITLDADMTLCYLPIARYGTDEQKAAYLPAAIAGTAIGAYAMSGPVGATDFAQQTTAAVKDRDGWLINGQKIFCTNAEAADVFLVFARVEDNVSPTCFIVERANPRKLGWNGSGTGTVVFENCWVHSRELRRDRRRRTWRRSRRSSREWGRWRPACRRAPGRAPRHRAPSSSRRRRCRCPSRSSRACARCPRSGSRGWPARR